MSYELILCSKCPRKRQSNCDECHTPICYTHRHCNNSGGCFCSVNCMEIDIERKLKGYCCTEMGELQEGFPGYLFQFDFTGEISMQAWGTYESEPIEESKFLINFCQFCGARLIK